MREIFWPLLLGRALIAQDIQLRGSRPENVNVANLPIPDDDSDVLTPPYWNLARKLLWG